MFNKSYSIHVTASSKFKSIRLLRRQFLQVHDLHSAFKIQKSYGFTSSLPVTVIYSLQENQEFLFFFSCLDNCFTTRLFDFFSLIVGLSSRKNFILSIFSFPFINFFPEQHLALFHHCPFSTIQAEHYIHSPLSRYQVEIGQFFSRSATH